MSVGSKEYKLAELLEHPMLAAQLTNEGIERRCVDLMLDMASSLRHSAEPEQDGMWSASLLR